MSVSSPTYSLTPFAPWGRGLHLENADRRPWTVSSSSPVAVASTTC